MSQENVEVLRAIYERWGRGDFWTPEVFDPEVEAVWASAVPDLGTSHGLHELSESFRGWVAALGEVRWKAERFIELPGDRVLVLMTTYARGRGSGIETEGKYAHIWTFRDGKATRIEGFIDWASARAKAGLDE
jgi:ketosteroid isomerase-like protein